jgi:hypothetical protein
LVSKSLRVRRVAPIFADFDSFVRLILASAVTW